MTEQEALAFNLIKEIMTDVASVVEDKIVMDADLADDLRLDELDYAMIAEALEDCGIECPMENEFRTVGDWVEYICQRYALVEDNE